MNGLRAYLAGDNDGPGGSSVDMDEVERKLLEHFSGVDTSNLRLHRTGEGGTLTEKDRLALNLPKSHPRP